MDTPTRSASVNPFVYWAQSNEQVFLRVELEAKGSPDVDLSAKTFTFSCDGIAPGHRDTQHFAFSIDLNDAVVSGEEGFRMDIGGSSIQFFLDKATEGFWPALLKTRNKPAWLKIDFNRFQSGDADSEEEKKDEVVDPDRPYKASIDNLLKDLKDKKPKMTQGPPEFKKLYLTAYNAFMLIGFVGIFISLLKNYIIHGSEFYSHTYKTVGTNFRIMQYAQALEVLHAKFGLVRSAPLTAFLQSFGRLVVLHIIHFQPHLHGLPAVFWLFVCWSAVELIRYPYYLAQVNGVMPKVLKVLRYTTWMVLYPAGMMLEVAIMLQGIQAYHVTHPALISLGSFDLRWSHLIAVYLCAFPFACIFLLKHMFKQTKSQLFLDKAVASKSKKIK